MRQISHTFKVFILREYLERSICLSGSIERDETYDSLYKIIFVSNVEHVESIFIGISCLYEDTSSNSRGADLWL